VVAVSRRWYSLQRGVGAIVGDLRLGPQHGRIVERFDSQ